MIRPQIRYVYTTENRKKCEPFLREIHKIEMELEELNTSQVELLAQKSKLELEILKLRIPDFERKKEEFPSK